MTYSALDIAKYVIIHEHKENFEVSNLRLQKLLYFIQAIILCKTNVPCFSDDMEAWPFGPVIPSVYYTYRIFGNMNIILSEQETMPIIDEATKLFIDNILKVCRRYKTFQLVEITHHQSPWIDAHKNGSKGIIEKSALKNYFLKA